MGTNEGWPEAFGFSISGGCPVVISEVEEGGSAQQAGLQPGDIITELDGEDVQQWNLEQIVLKAHGCDKVPPSLVVISRVRNFRLHRDQSGGYGITLRGNGPVFIRSVDVPSVAREAGLRSGDLILEIDGQNVRHAPKLNVLERLRHSGTVLSLTVIASGLNWNHPPPVLPPPSSSSSSSSSLLTQSQKRKNIATYQKASNFHNMVTYYLIGDSIKRNHLLTLLRLYAQNRNIDSLSRSLDVLLDDPIERKLIPAIREFLQSRHQVRYDSLLSSVTSLSSTMYRRGSVDQHGMQPRSLAATRGSPWCSSLPSLLTSGSERLVCIDRGNGSYGFSLSGNAPVFIRSVNTGGPAQLAGLKPGDRLLAINGLNIRNATHSHVVRLLRGSGTSPSLLVSTIMQDRPTSSRHDRGVVGGARSMASSGQQTNILQEKMEQILEPHERELVIKQLNQYSKQKDIPQLVEGLHTILSDPRRMMLFHYICQLLPQQAQVEFDRIAITSLSGSGGERISANGLQEIGVLEDTAIGSVGESEGFVGDSLEGATRPVEGATGTAGMIGENIQSEKMKGQKEKRRSFENTPVCHRLSSSLLSSRPLKRQSTEATPPATPTTMADITTSSTPGLIPPPPPTPVMGPGGIPLPPPPPPSSLTSQPHMKRVNWQKMTRTDGTVWGELTGLDEAIELAELDSQFALRKSKESSTSLQNKKPSILDSKKAYNISILLGHLKLSHQAIKEAVLSCNNTVLQEQHLRQMEDYAPDKKECLGFAHYYGNPSILGPSDLFSCEMSTIPCYKERLHSMIFRLHYQDKVDEIHPDLEAICRASVQLKKSKRLKKILEMVLAIGNHMNMGNIRIGQAQGFHIRFLSQLRGLRTTDGKSSLLNFLAGLTERKFPEILAFHEDISFCTQAARVSDQTLEIEMNELSQGLQDIKRYIKEISSKDKLPGDRFHDVMTRFLADSEGKMTELLTLYTCMKEEYKHTVIFFGEDPAKMRIDDFFSIFASFMTDFKKALDENRQNRLEEIRREQLSEDRGTAKRRGQSSKPHPPDKDQYQQFKEELEKTRLRPIPHDKQTGMEWQPQQTNFKHLLRPTQNKATVTMSTIPTPTPHDNETFF